MPSKEISVIMATFNAAPTLNAAIDSILSQRCSCLELIIIDGGSLDITSHILQSYGTKIDYWISEPDRGIYDAWNKGLKFASGEWIAFLGADDIFYLDAISSYREFLSENPGLDFVSSRVQLRYLNGSTRLIGQAWSWPKFRRFMNIAHIGAFHHRSLFEKFGVFNADLKICGDYDFLLRARSGLNAGFIDHPLAEMAAGGVSDLSILSIWETFMVKANAKSVNAALLLFDFFVSFFKLLLRRLVLMFADALKVFSHVSPG